MKNTTTIINSTFIERFYLQDLMMATKSGFYIFYIVYFNLNKFLMNILCYCVIRSYNLHYLLKVIVVLSRL